MTCLRALAVASALGVALQSMFLFAAPPGATQEPVRVDLVGDSLLRMTYESDGDWIVNGWNGRSLHGSQLLLAKIARAENDILVVALGTNDVAQARSQRTMSWDVERSIRNTSTVPCVIFTTVTQFGTPFYNPRWAVAARSFNRALWDHGVHVADWSREVRLHREYLQADGVHPTAAGRIAYDRLLRDSAARLCGDVA